MALLGIFLWAVTLSVFSHTHTARIVKLENKSEVYVPGENKKGTFVHVKYQGEVYHIIEATKGMKLENGFILTTGPLSKVKVVFTNGDHFFIAENSQYKINWKTSADGPKKDPSVINLIRGAMRAVIEKDGPRAGLKVKTQNAVMGVRGTDFYVNEKYGFLNVSVIRGEVEVGIPDSPKAPIKIKTGESLNQKDNVSKLQVLSKEELALVSQVSAIKNTEEEDKPVVTTEIVNLEEEASKMTLKDIKEYRPDLYKELTEGQKPSELTSDNLAMGTIKIMEKVAPSRARKALERDLNEIPDPYDKYKVKKKK